ncbi:DUF559 domain-containing protein [Actinomycetaceae bacterium WB03_NA08]|uniref:DUF559 domain-containing protein n=2 Tax=Scrofimicrobium canadense TaxID=2652290 RepID=A0A6N7W4W2_9ACTO|nr:DUF559 domain-containing protein [Scrofimicrobium canadense]
MRPLACLHQSGSIGRMSRRPLPNELRDAFTVAEANAHGVSSSRLRAADPVLPTSGIRATTTADPLEVLRAFLKTQPPWVCIAGTTAAALYELPLPSRIRSLDGKMLDRITVAVPHDRPQVQRKGFVCARREFKAGEVQVFRGVRVTSPLRTWHDISAMLKEHEFLAVSDVLLRSWASREEMQQWNDAHPNTKGARLRKLVVPLADGGAESPQESVLRWHLIKAGLPRPECNPRIALPGGMVVRPDLLFRDALLVVEYHGIYHYSTPDQGRKDEQRRRRLEAAGFTVIVVVNRDFQHISSVIQQVRTCLAEDTKRTLDKGVRFL